MWSYCLQVLTGVAAVGPGLAGRVAKIQIMLSDTGALTHLIDLQSLRNLGDALRSIRATTTTVDPAELVATQTEQHRQGSHRRARTASVC
eukprot:5706335-Prymnesium_polylepis.1